MEKIRIRDKHPGSATLCYARTVCGTEHLTHFIRCRLCSIFRNSFFRSTRCEPDEHGLRPNNRGGRRHPGRRYRQVPHGQEEGIRATHHQPRYALRTLFVRANVANRNIISFTRVELMNWYICKIIHLYLLFYTFTLLNLFAVGVDNFYIFYYFLILFSMFYLFPVV